MTEPRDAPFGLADVEQLDLSGPIRQEERGGIVTPRGVPEWLLGIPYHHNPNASWHSFFCRDGGDLGRGGGPVYERVTADELNRMVRAVRDEIGKIYDSEGGFFAAMVKKDG